MDEWEPSDGSYPPEVFGPFVVVLTDWDGERLTNQSEWVADGALFQGIDAGVAKYALITDQSKASRTVFVPLVEPVRVDRTVSVRVAVGDRTEINSRIKGLRDV